MSRASVARPVARADQPPVLILTGPPGAGKTTTAHLLAERSARSVHLESDEFFRFIQSGYVEPWKPESHPQNVAVMGIVAAAAASYAEAGFFTIIDGIVSPAWFFDPLRASLQAAGHAVAYAVLRPAPSVCLKRTEGRESSRFGESEVVERLWTEFADLGPLERNVIDTGNNSPVEIVDLLAEHLNSGLLAITED